MIRLLTFFFWVVVAASALTALLALSSEASIEAFGWRFETPTGVAAFLIAAFTTLVVLFASFVKDLADAPKRARARAEVKRRDRGLAALTQGFNAVAAGDAAASRKQAQLALKTLGDAPAAKLLAAAAARLSADAAGADAALSGLVEAPDTELLALRALKNKCEAAGDADGARRHAERAFAGHPGARWAFDGVFDHALGAGDFGAAEDALLRAAKAGALDISSAHRGVAAAKGARAFAANRAGDAGAALALADGALKYDASFPPAAILSARLHAAATEKKKALKTLETAFAANGADAIADAVEALLADEPAAARAERLASFAALKDAAPSSALLRARAALLKGEAGGAAQILEDALRNAADPRALALMAEASAALYGEAAAHGWLKRAAAAPRASALRSADFDRLDAAAWALVVRAWRDEARLPPLAPAPEGLSPQDFERLAPPPLPLQIAAPTVDAALIAPDTDDIIDREAMAARGVN